MYKQIECKASTLDCFISFKRNKSVESSSYFQALVHKIHFSTQKKRKSPSFTCFSSSAFLNGETAHCDITPSQVAPVSDLPWGSVFLQDGAKSGLSWFSGAWKLFSSVETDRGGIKTEVHHWVRVRVRVSPTPQSSQTSQRF